MTLPPLLPPGYYRVTQDINNPLKDGRSNAWHKLPVIRKGQLLNVRLRRISDKVVINTFGSRSFSGEEITISKRNLEAGKFDLAFEVQKHLERLPVDLYEISHRTSCSRLLETLVNAGLITLEQLDALIQWDEV